MCVLFCKRYKYSVFDNFMTAINFNVYKCLLLTEYKEQMLSISRVSCPALLDTVNV